MDSTFRSRSRWMGAATNARAQPGAAAGRHAGPHRLARAACRRRRQGARFLLRLLRLEKDQRFRYGADGRLPHVRHRTWRAGRNHDPHAADAGVVLALLFQCRRRGRSGRARQGRRWSDRQRPAWKCPADNGSCRRPTFRARCSRCSPRNGDPPDPRPRAKRRGR